MEKYALITGGASGLGLELSKRFAKDGHNLYLVSSNEEKLKNAKKELEQQYNVKIKYLAIDLSNNQNFKLVKEYSDFNNMFVDVLVNCAGFGDCTDFKDMDADRQIRMIELNCNCPLYLMNVYLKDMLTNKEGHIVNINSIAAFIPGPYMCTYHASKAFLLNLSEAIDRELKGTPVKLTTVCPGPFLSDFVSKAHNDYTFMKMKPLSASKVADISYQAYLKKKHMRVIGFMNRFVIFITRFFPRRFVASVSAKQLKDI